MATESRWYIIFCIYNGFEVVGNEKKTVDARGKFAS